MDNTNNQQLGQAALVILLQLSIHYLLQTSTVSTLPVVATPVEQKLVLLLGSTYNQSYNPLLLLMTR